MSHRPIKLKAWDSRQHCFVAIHALSELDNPDLTPVEFTGMYDASGREIWEGDVLHYQVTDTDEDTYEAWYEVLFHNGSFGTGVGGEFEAFSGLNLIQDRVVGNAFEDSHLLDRLQFQLVSTPDFKSEQSK